MEKEQRVFLTYRAIFEGTLSQVRQTKAISKVVSQNRKSATTLLKSLGEKEVIPVLKSLLERKVFESEVEAKLAFPNLFTTSLAQDVQHNASEADAARSEAEALEDIIFQGGDRDDVSKNEIDEVSSVLAAAPLTQACTSTNDLKIKSLYPVYIPYKIQYLVLTRAQQLLEQCCYDFTAEWLPELHEQRGWDCYEAIELNEWTCTVVKRLPKLPPNCPLASAQEPEGSLVGILTSINNIRHSAVHRLPTTAKGILEMIRSATGFARVLQDSVREEQFHELYQQLEGKIRASELNKNFLETKLEDELQKIARKRKELDEMEKESVAMILKQDEDHGSLIGVLLSESVTQIFDRNGEKDAEVTRGDLSSDHEPKVGMEVVDDVKYGLAQPVDPEPVIMVNPISDSDTDLEMCEPKPARVNAMPNTEPSSGPIEGYEPKHDD